MLTVKGHQSGYNPMRWDCNKSGCYNVKHRPKIEQFHDIWPGRISMSDVDGIVEINGNFLLLEWKSVAKPMPTGQRIMYERMTVGKRFTVLVVTGNAEHMTAESWNLYYGGRIFPKDGKPRQCNMDAVRKIMQRWCANAAANPRIGRV